MKRNLKSDKEQSELKKDEVINYLLNKQLIERLGTTFQSYLGNDVQDFVQDMWEIVLNIPEEKLVGLYERKELDYYLLKIAKLQAVNENSKFHKLYNNKYITFIEGYHEEDGDEDYE